MANLPETEDFAEGTYQIETSDRVLGGPGGIANKQAEQLGNRTAWLRAAIAKIISGATAVGQAAQLATARTLKFKGAVSGSGSYDGSADTEITLTLADSGVAAGSYTKVVINSKGVATAGSNPATLASAGITDGATKTELTNGLASKQASLGFAPVQQGTGVGQSTNPVKIGWSNNSTPQLRVTVDDSDQGYFWLSSNFNPATKADVATTPTKTELSNGLAAKPNADDVSYVGFASGDARQPYFRKKANDAVYLLQPALGYTPVQQGTGIGQSANPVKIGHSPNGPKITVDNTDFGLLWCQNNFSPDGKADKSNTYTIEQVEAGLANRPMRDSITAVGLASNDPNQPYMRRASDNSLVMLAPANSVKPGLGHDQTWQNVTSSRAFSTTYTNSTGRPIMIAIGGLYGAGMYDYVTASINGGATFPFCAGASTSGQTRAAGTLVIPAGATYNLASNIPMTSWWELR